MTNKPNNGKPFKAPTEKQSAKPQTAPPVAKLAYSREEAAQALSMSTETLDRLTKRGLLNPSRACRRPLYRLAELERFLAETGGNITA